jgi:hypothetical protein
VTLGENKFGLTFLFLRRGIFWGPEGSDQRRLTKCFGILASNHCSSFRTTAFFGQYLPQTSSQESSFSLPGEAITFKMNIMAFNGKQEMWPISQEVNVLGWGSLNPRYLVFFGLFWSFLDLFPFASTPDKEKSARGSSNFMQLSPSAANTPQTRVPSWSSGRQLL